MPGDKIKQNTGNPASENDEFDEYELYYGENAVKDEDPPVKRNTGPLSRRPAISSMIYPIAFSLLFIICMRFQVSPTYGDLIWASRETVFNQHQYWRLFTALFAHADLEHLLSNTPLFLIFGVFLYEYFGLTLFPVVSLLIGAASNAVTLYFYPDSVRLLGASGMIYGMAALWLVLYIYHDTDRTMAVRILRAIGFALIVLFPETYNPSTSYLAHGAGFFIGIAAAVILLPVISVKGADNAQNDSSG